MAAFLASLSLGELAGLVALLSAIPVLLVELCAARIGWPAWVLRALRLLSVVAIPLALAYCAYWWPAWSAGSDYAQYDAWAPLGITALFLPALLVALAIAFVPWFLQELPRARERSAAQAREERGDRHLGG